MVLITRPLNQALELQELFTKNKIDSIIFPTLEIKKISPSLEKNYDFVIFISKNSVDFGIDYLKNLKNYKLLAVGGSTAKQLEEYNFKADFYPKAKPSSESLLSIPQVASIKNKNILIIRGKGGVNTLKDAFIKNDNTVDYLEVYGRVVNPDIDKYKQNFTDFLASNNTQVIVITSVDVLLALLQLVKNIDKNIRLIVVSRRIEKQAKILGFNRIVVTNGISGNSILKGVKLWLN